MKKTLITILCAFVLVGITAIGFAKDKGVDTKEKTITIAGFDATTGKYGDYGQANQWGQEIAVDEINSSGGIAGGPLKGYKLKLDFYDDKGDAKESANIAKKVSEDDYLLVIGSTFSSCVLAASPVYNRNRIGNIITYANADTITQQGFDNIIRLTHTTNNIAREMAKTVKEKFNKTKVAVISDNLDYGQQMSKKFKENAKDVGLEITSETTVTPGQDVDFRSVLLQAKSKEPEMVVIFVSFNEAGFIVRQTRDMGWDIPIFATDSITDPKFKELAGTLENVYIQIVPSIDPTRPEAVNLAKVYQEKYKTLPPLSAIYGYDAMKIAAKIIADGGVDREEFIKGLRIVKMPGVASPMYEFDDTGEGKQPLFETVTATDYFAKGE